VPAVNLAIFNTELPYMKQIVLSCFAALLVCVGTAQSLSVAQLRCESRVNPLGIDVAHPLLSWTIQSDKQAVAQKAYRMLVADDAQLLDKNIGNIWDSKKVVSGASIQVEYDGKLLSSAKKYYWKLMVWDNRGNVSPWSARAQWRMGLLKKNDWGEAKWIGYSSIQDTAIIVPFSHGNGKKTWGSRPDVLPVLRKTFTVTKKVKSATAFISGLGHFELTINGKKIGDHFLAPGWTNYSKQAQYVSFDVTANIQEKNAIGVILGNGFYYIPSQRYRKMTGAFGYPKMIAKIRIEYTDSSAQDIVSDASWKVDASPIVYSSIYGGEDYDANLYQEGWNTPVFNDAHWKPAVITDGPPTLIAQIEEPVKIMQYLSSKRVTTGNNGKMIYDLGQNFSGIPSITVKGNKGDTVRLYTAELVNDNGTINQKTSGTPTFFNYILKGSTVETWHPMFTYTGFRYVEVQPIAKNNGDKTPEILQLQGLHIRNAAQTVGAFSSSNTLFNKTDTLINWAMKSNMMSVFTDCPHREKLGWLEQTHLMGASMHYNYDIATLNRKVISDMQNAQYTDGKIPEISPEFTVFTPPFDESPEWGSAAVILPWYNYQWYGDKRTLSEAYNMMKNYVLYLDKKSTNHLLSHGLGDWYDIGPKGPGESQLTKKGITGTAIFYYDINILVEAATILNNKTDVDRFNQLAREVKMAFNQKFYDKVKQQYDSSSQTANAMALYMGLVEDQHRTAVVEALIREIRSKNNALTAGDVGYRYVLKALEQAGRNDVIFDMNYRDDVPGYGFQLKRGATALTESWQANTTSSNNHFMLGHLMEWLYGSLAGIGQTAESIAYKEVEIKPEVVGDVHFANGSLQTPYGLVTSVWTIKGGNFTLDVHIPVNSSAIVYLPASEGATFFNNGKKIAVDVIHGKGKVNIGSGKYQFRVVNR